MRLAQVADRPVVERLWLMFRHDLSEFRGVLPNSDGTFRSDRLQAAFADADWAPYLVTSGERPVGFAVVRGLTGPTRVLNSFFVARGARRAGIGLRAVREVLAQHPGPWEVAFQDHNPAAVHFWRRVATEVAGRAWTEERRPVPDRPELPPDVWISFAVPEGARQIITSHTNTAAAAGTWKLGDLTVNRVGFGAMRLTGGAAFDLGRPSDRERSINVLRRAVELGVNHIDTAAFYFSSLRSANELISRALAPYPDDLVIATKVWPGRDPSGGWWWATPEQLRGQVEENLRQLGRDHLDVVNLRVPPSRKTGSIAEHFGALADLRDAGLIRHLGISNATPEHLAEAQAIAPVVCVQNAYGVGASAEEQAFLQACGEQGVAFVPFFAIAGAGREAGASATDSETVLAAARAHDVTPAQVRLAWTLHQGPHVLAIPGTGNPEHLAANVAAGALRLSDDEIARLSSLY
ncbi:aryl-alcohol dehydrogenase-like predicted oxidoreductase/predicted acetyltransferase [Streptosporangium album]|uniref:Aryl-alcohol dehydrogenase-like predicted oxidoreductase/predicted acetyltransferase n=1 Tax=Streptosporangium album TaxID=47479 RepID=A0A7W7RYD1_9ACTN|nr:aldo/keto reductase [Streptosporangium album]MBB4940519.1 aryl-alcohol dehydrogenase-like predicted oxidoreductase/predicted acetyltransferase [Streptosporangium album]